ncbi:hypothetical protein PMM47T1_14506 [Pseudomonas sp. M47T1]|uniref:DUF3203 family protein n=1 Tax=Pseudomonas sp. M47T1 TaxID=1179778 RepID=UPI0002608AE3|nr:DUF3203 family protein [Pseudomonas sp. M47T1]EIK95877.1 hypothetical protein PMM47T1_14506 [Pseudomonas sp. M47T1]
MPVEINAQTQRCTLIEQDMRCEGAATDVRISTDDQLRMSIAELNGHRVPITEAEADALTVAGAVDDRHHVKASVSGSVI